MAREDLEREELLRQLGQADPGGGGLPDIGGALSTPMPPDLGAGAAMPPAAVTMPSPTMGAELHGAAGAPPVASPQPEPIVPPTGGPVAGDPDADRAWRKELRTKAIGSQSGQSSGWNTGDYGGDDVAATSMKNTFHAIAQRYPSTPSGLRQLVQDPDFQRAFPQARIVDHPTGDKIDFGGQLSDFTKGVPVGIVDVGRAFDGGADSGEGWDWMDEAAAGGGAGGGGGGGLDVASLIGQGEELTGNDRMAEILAMIEALGRGDDPTRDALMNELGR